MKELLAKFRDHNNPSVPHNVFIPIPEVHGRLFEDIVLGKESDAMKAISTGTVDDNELVATNCDNNTTLHIALILGWTKIAAALIQLNSVRTIMNYENNFGQCPIDIALQVIDDLDKTSKLKGRNRTFCQNLLTNMFQLSNRDIKIRIKSMNDTGLKEKGVVRCFLQLADINNESTLIGLGASGSEFRPKTKSIKQSKIKERNKRYGSVVMLHDPNINGSVVSREQFLKQFWKKLPVFLQTKIYQQKPWFSEIGRGTDELNYLIFNMINDYLSEMHAESGPISIDYVIENLCETLSVPMDTNAFEANEVNLLKMRLLSFLHTHLNDAYPALSLFMQRSSYGLVNLYYIQKITQSCLKKWEQDALMKHLAHLQTYSLVRGTLNHETDYILQPLSNLIESVFNCHILGYEHHSKITSLINSLNQAKSILKRSDNGENNDIQSLHALLACCVDLLQELMSFKASSLELSGGFEEWIDDSISINKEQLEKLAIAFEQSVSNSFGDFDNFKQSLDQFFPDPNYLECEPIESNPELAEGTLTLFYKDRPNAPTTEISRNNSITSLDQLIKNRITRVQYKQNFAEFPPLLPNAYQSPIQKIQLTLFLMLHGDQVRDSISLRSLCQNIANPVNSTLLNVTSEIRYLDGELRKILTTSSPDQHSAMDNVCSVTQLSYRDHLVSKRNTQLPLGMLPNFYTTLYTHAAGQQKIVPGLGFLIIFVDENKNKLGFMTRKRTLQTPNRYCVTYGGYANAQHSILKCVDEFMASNREFFPSDEAHAALEILSNQIKNSFSKGSAAASIEFRYKAPPHDKYEPFCYLTVEVLIEVQDLEHAREMYKGILTKPEDKPNTLVYEIIPWSTQPGSEPELKNYLKDKSYRSDKKIIRENSDPVRCAQAQERINTRRLAVSTRGLEPFLFFSRPKQHDATGISCFTAGPSSSSASFYEGEDALPSSSNTSQY